MIIENKSNLYDSIVQIVNSANKDVNIYTRVGVVREIEDDGDEYSIDRVYTVELLNETFNFDTPNVENYLYEVENITDNKITDGTYVYLTYITNDYPVIFETKESDSKFFVATNLLEFSGATIDIHTGTESDPRTQILMDDIVTISSIEKIILNSDENGGLIKIEDLTAKINELVDSVNSFVSTYNAHIHVTTATVAATPTPGVIAPPTAQAQAASSLNKSDYENEDITHGSSI